MLNNLIKSRRERSLSTSSNKILADRLWIKILIGMALGVLTGTLLSPEGLALIPSESAYALGEWIKIPGVIFLSLIQMVIVPLVVCSIILGIAESGSTENIKKLGLRLVPYFLFTTSIAISIGIFFVQLIKPGLSFDPSLIEATLSNAPVVPAQNFSDLTVPQRIGNLIATNPARAELDRNMLQIVVASIIIGLALLSVGKTGKAFHDLCLSGQTLSMKVISWAMVIAPYAVFGLLCNITIQIGAKSLVGVGLYMSTVLLALATMMGVYLLIVRFLGKHSPASFLAGIREAQLIAFSTSSSAATMPISIQCAEEKLHVDERVSRFTIPLGATINMDGTALYQAIAALFLCQVFHIDLSYGEIGLLLITTVGASIGTPATPGVGIVVLATILVGIGVPAEGIALIIGVDRILDMCRTTINVTGDLAASTVMQRFYK